MTLWECGGSLTLVARENSRSLSCFHCSGFQGRRERQKWFFSLSRRIPPPLGLGALCPTRLASRHLLSLNIPIQVLYRPFFDKQPNCGDRTISVFIFIGGWICWVQTNPLCHHQNETKDNDRRPSTRRRPGTERRSERNLEDIRRRTWSLSAATKGRRHHDQKNASCAPHCGKTTFISVKGKIPQSQYISTLSPGFLPTLQGEEDDSTGWARQQRWKWCNYSVSLEIDCIFK